MARRRIGQERLGVIDSDAGTALDQLAALIDWADIDRHLVGIYAAAKGERGWPPLALFRAMLLAVWHDLSAVKLAEALADRASFRRFCGFAAAEPTPERTAFVRFARRADPALPGPGFVPGDHATVAIQRCGGVHRQLGGCDADRLGQHSSRWRSALGGASAPQAAARLQGAMSQPTKRRG
jgi:hypothetical protein